MSEHTRPDGGWGWFVCFASFLSQMISLGTTLSFGIIFVDFLDYFHSDESTTSWIGSIQGTLIYLTGFFATPLVRKIGCRWTAILGGIFNAIGFGTSVFATNVYVLYVTYGVFTGLGNGLMYFASLVVIELYFDKRIGLANGIALSGAGLGIVIFGVSMPYLVTRIGWRVTLLIYAVMSLIAGVTSGALYKPIKDTRTQKQTTVTHNKYTHTQKQPTETHNKPGLFNKGKNESLPKSKTYTQLLEAAPLLGNNDQDFIFYSTIPGGMERNYKQIRANDNQRQALSFGPSLDSGYKARFSLASCEMTTSITKNVDEKDPSLLKSMESVLIPAELKVNSKETLSELYGLYLLQYPVFWLFSFTLLTFTYIVFVTYTYMPEWAMTLGAPYTLASMFVPIAGVGSMITRLLCGWVCDKVPQHRFVIAGCLFALKGILGLISPCLVDYPTLTVYAVGFGMSSGALYTMYPVILSDLVGHRDFDKALGLVLAITSLGTLTAGPISGVIIQCVGEQNITVPFIVFGAVQSIGCVTFFLIKSRLVAAAQARAVTAARDRILRRGNHGNTHVGG